MKKLIQIIAITGFFLQTGVLTSSATIHNVTVQDFMFSPNIFTATVGDTVHWAWLNGSHTTTSGDIPPSAQSWDQPLNAGSPAFDYIITAAGSYDYVCTPHASMGMNGHFTVVNATGIAENAVPSLNLVKMYVESDRLFFDYTSPGLVQLNVLLYDLLGKRVHEEAIPSQLAGINSYSIPVGTLPNGVYVFSLIVKNSQITKRIVIE